MSSKYVGKDGFSVTGRM